MASEPDARSLLREAWELHARGQIDTALAVARDALRDDAELSDAWTYLGTTLITRKLAYSDGLEALERAYALKPDDPGVNYSLGWCYEFVAYRLSRLGRKPYRDPEELFGLAINHLRRCIELEPEQKLREDAEGLLDSILARY